MPQIRSPISCLLLCLCLTACTKSGNDTGKQQTGGLSPAGPAGEVFVFDCADNLTYSVQVEEEQAWLHLPDTTVKLGQEVSASGVKFASENFLFWNKGDSALFEINGRTITGCRNNERKAVWEKARLSGVDFRGLGQEPGWLLDIRTGEHILFAHNYGQDSVFTPVPNPVKSEKEQKTTYLAETEAHLLKVEIWDRACTDAMSGFPFPSTVKVTLDGKTYEGCGRALSCFD